MKQLFLMGAFLLFASSLFAQQKTYSGTVSDEAGKPMSGHFFILDPNSL